MSRIEKRIRELERANDELKTEMKNEFTKIAKIWTRVLGTKN